MTGVLQQLGRRIREIRIQRGFTSQEAFAEYLKVHRTFVGHLETGRKDFRLSSIIRIAQALEVPLAELFAGVETGAPFKAQGREGTGRGRYALLKEVAVLEEAVGRLKEIAGGRPGGKGETAGRRG